MIAVPQVEELLLPEHVRHISINFKQPPKIKFVNPNVDNYENNIKYASDLHKNKGFKLIQKDDLKDKGVIICGSGNTLKDPKVLGQIKQHQEEGMLLVACKQAIKFLHDKGFTIDYAVSMDPGDHIANPGKIYKAPGITHIIASSSDPALFKYLEREKIMIFHSACGVKNEIILYKKQFDNADVMGGGYNVINRALAAFMYMGCNKIVMAGIDSGWRDGDSFYVDGTNNRPGVDMCDNGKVEMTPQEQKEYMILKKKLELMKYEKEKLIKLEDMVWWTRPDMLASAVALARVARNYSKENFIILGSCLPLYLREKNDKFLEECVSFH